MLELIVLIRVKINTQAINCHKSQLQFTTQLFCELKSLKHTHIIHLVKIGVTKGGKTQGEDVKSIFVQSLLYLHYRKTFSNLFFYYTLEKAV